MLPVRKRDVVRAKFALAACVELAGFVLAAAFTAVRMTALAGAPVYVNNAMMSRIKGEDEDGDGAADSGCTGNCAACGGCSR